MDSQISPIRRTTLSAEVADRLTEAIRMGQFEPGERLPSERDLGVRFGVGRTSIREAIRTLQATGLVTVRPGAGMFIADDQSISVEPFANWESRYQYRIDELFETRLALEPVAAARAAARASREEIEEIALCVRDLEQAIADKSLAAMVLADAGFHFAVVKASKNRLILTMLQSLRHVLAESQRASLSPAERPRRVLAMHTAVLEAIAARDSLAAETAMRSHLMSFLHDMGVLSPEE